MWGGGGGGGGDGKKTCSRKGATENFPASAGGSWRNYEWKHAKPPAPPPPDKKWTVPNTLERKCAIKDDIFPVSVKILFRRLRSCFNIFVEFISVGFSKCCCLWPTRLDHIRISRRVDRLILGFLWQIKLRNPQHGQISVITAHFRELHLF